MSETSDSRFTRFLFLPDQDARGNQRAPGRRACEDVSAPHMMQAATKPSAPQMLQVELPRCSEHALWFALRHLSELFISPILDVGADTSVEVRQGETGEGNCPVLEDDKVP